MFIYAFFLGTAYALFGGAGVILVVTVLLVQVATCPPRHSTLMSRTHRTQRKSLKPLPPKPPKPARIVYALMTAVPAYFLLSFFVRM